MKDIAAIAKRIFKIKLSPKGLKFSRALQKQVWMTFTMDSIELSTVKILLRINVVDSIKAETANIHFCMYASITGARKRI